MDLLNELNEKCRLLDNSIKMLRNTGNMLKHIQIIEWH